MGGEIASKDDVSMQDVGADTGSHGIVMMPELAWEEGRGRRISSSRPAWAA
jgi:hypothetical protein